jgi:hypothetical protein
VRSVYLEKLLNSSEALDRKLGMFLAIMSSSSIAGWAMWIEYASVWAFLIASSQLVNAILPHLAFKERIKAFSGLARDLRQLAITLESKWLDIAAGELSEKEMRKIYSEYLRREAEFEDRHFSGKSVPRNSALFSEAEDEVLIYLSTHMHNGDENDREEDTN